MASALEELFRQEGYEVRTVSDGEAALSSVRSGKFDVIVLDVMMPKLNGYDVATCIRQEGNNTPILMLTAKSSVDDKVTGLDCGADDYLTKPFMSRELLARLRALTRRAQGKKDDDLAFGDIKVSKASVQLTCTTTGQSVKLSEKEFRILEYMIENKDMILSREQLALRIWGYDSEAEYNNVEVYMTFTRKKLSFVGARTEIKAVRGLGYELRCADVP